MLLDLDPTRPRVTPTDAATLVLLRDGTGGIEVFCVERNQKSRFMGGALVFPGGKVDAEDGSATWDNVVLPARSRIAALADTPVLQRALAIAACRESLEEAAILPVDGALTHAEALRLRQTLTTGVEAFRAALLARGLLIDLASLVPFARWVTPAAEARRFDARFFMLRAPSGQDGAHDEHETMSSVWARPADVLARWDSGHIQLAPPTHHTLWTLSRLATVDDALTLAETLPLAPIEPHLVDCDGTIALALPGDPAHPQAERIIEGQTRYVHRNEQWRPEGASH
jgi:8-oxo-dGTP pyrophosphatase MutT (NUDIX family)